MGFVGLTFLMNRRKVGRPAASYRLLKFVLIKWIMDEGPLLGAALAYYSLFSLAPMLLIALTIAGIIYGENAAKGELEHQLTGYFGAGVSKSIQSLLTAMQNRQGGNLGTVILGIGAILFGASSVFNTLKIALDRIWNVEQPRAATFKNIIFGRLLALGMVIVVGLLLLSSLIISTAISRLEAFATEVLPVSPQALQISDLGITFLLLSILFAIIFRYLPDVRIGWSNVVLGAIVTAVLFAVGKFLIGLYIARGGVEDSYGAASSVLVLLVWIYYSAMIFLFGAEFTYVYSRALHLPVEPIEDEPDSE